jgi:hypothetical protein
MASVTIEAGSVSHAGDGSASILTTRIPAALVGSVVGRPAAGLAMRLDCERDRFHLVLLDVEHAALQTFGSYTEEDIVAEWRRLGAASGLELKIQLPNGAILSPYPQIGRVLLGPTRRRRRHGLLAHRRPRFLTRRKTGFFPLIPLIHRETEIARGER